MKTRTASILLGILAIVCFGLVFSAVYPFTTSTPRASAPASERFTVGDADGFSATGQIVVDGDVKLAFDGVVTGDGTWYQRVVEPTVTSETCHPSPNSSVYQRLTIARRDRAASIREQITEDDDRTLLRENRSGDHVTFVIEQNNAAVTEPVSGTASVFVDSLSAARYEKTGSDSSAMTVYEPRSAWYDGRRAYRITGASGEVSVDGDTRAVQLANVSWAVTDPAGSYVEYIVARMFGGDPTTQRITYDFDSTDTALEHPSWAGDTDSPSCELGLS